MKAEFSLETERLQIRDCDEGGVRELDFLADVFGDAVFQARTGDLPVDRMRASEVVRAIAADALVQESWCGPKFAELRSSRTIVGWFTLQHCSLDGRDDVELGWAIGRKYWRRGLAYEGALAMRDFAFSVLRLDSLCATIDASNHASIALAHKLGASYVGEVDYRGTGRPRRIGYYRFAAADPE